VDLERLLAPEVPEPPAVEGPPSVVDRLAAVGRSEPQARSR